MHITPEQISSLEDVAATTFEARIIEFLHQKFPDASETPQAQLKHEIKNQISLSRSYGLSTEEQIATYITTAWALGTDFHSKFPAARAILVSDDLTPADKAKALTNWTKSLFSALKGR